MPRTLRPWTTAGVAVVGAGLIAVTPVAPPLSDVQHRSVQLTSYDEFDLAQLTSATEANWTGLESVLGSSNWLTDPDISQGLTNVFTDLSTGAANPVTNPFSLLTELSLLFTSSDYAFNAASTASTAVFDNVESALSSGDYTAALTDLENGPTTVMYAFLNGYPQALGSDLISPQLGLLTNTADGASTGSIDAWQQVSNTVADEVANAGGANLPTGSLPLLTGNVDLSISINQILSDLGLGSAGSLTINGILGDLGVNPTSNIIPSLDIGQVLGYLGLSDTSGISINTALQDLGINTSGTVTVDSILSDLGVNPNAGISVDSILSALNISPTSTFSIDSILNDLGISTTGTLSVAGILNDLGLSTTGTLSVGSILGDLGINTSSTIGLESILSGLGIATSGNITLPFSIDTLLSDVGVSSSVISVVNSFIGGAGSAEPSISVSSLLGDLGLNGSYSISSLLSALGLNGSYSINSILTGLGLNNTFSLDTILSDLGLNGTFNVDDILSVLGLSGTSSLSLNQALGDLGINGSYSLDSLLSAIGISPSSSIDIGDILNVFSLSDSSAIPLPSVSIDSILSALNINPNENLFTLLGIPSTLTLSPTLDLTGGSVQAFDLALSQDLLAVLGSFSQLASDLPSLLTNNPTLDLVPLLSSLLSDLGLPGVITGGNLSADLTNIVAELLPGLVP